MYEKKMMMPCILVLFVLMFGCIDSQSKQTTYVCNDGTEVMNPESCSNDSDSEFHDDESSSYTLSTCISKTKDEAQCKDCCDCIDGDVDTRKTCRDNCIEHDFSLNSETIEIKVQSELGANGDYSLCSGTGNEQECKECCDGSELFSCGDRRFCRDVCNAMGGGEITPPTQEPEDIKDQQDSQKHNIEQATSDKAQLNTLSFSALAFISGDDCSDTFLPPGKVADFSGFQYLRDNDPDEMGHNTEFVTMAADNILTILEPDQIEEFMVIDSDQTSMSDEYAYMRFPLMNAFRRQLTGDIPTGSSGLNKSAIIEYSAKLYKLDANISLQRAKAFGNVIRSLTEEQREYLDNMGEGGSLSWPKVSEPEILKTSGISSVDLRTYASEFYSWYAGSVEADTYFCPERQATYFGAFYMKDAPAMGNRNYSISTEITGDSGEAFREILDETQETKITSLVDIQRDDLNEIVTIRRAIATELRKLMTEDEIDEEKILSLGERYGELDGEISYYYAMHFSDVGQTLTDDQMAYVLELRNLEDFKCEGAYLYSEKIALPEFESSDFLFE